MKFFSFITLVIPVYAVAMENQLQITNRHLDTCTRPHITIINQLPDNDLDFANTRIDISDQTKIKTYSSASYRPDDSTKTIYANKGIRFSPQAHTNIHEYKRLGMSDTKDNALIAVYVHGLEKNQLMHFVIGKGSDIQFGDVVTFAMNNKRDIVLKNNDTIVRVLKYFQTAGDNQDAPSKTMSEKAQRLFKQHIRIRTNTCALFVPELPVHLIGLPDNYLNSIEEYPYIKGITMEARTFQ
ncbi:MAG TPA: hypothetical protein VKU36_00170 [Candidatus Babeliales bacterium]|nr:hypothetical protein [Candidatus Babeliales bacterium]